MSNRKLVVSFPPLNDSQKGYISNLAGEHGFDTVFCTDPDKLKKEVADAEILFCFNSSLITPDSSLKWVCTPSAGVDHFLDKIRGSGIILTSSSGAYGVTIAEHIVMMTLEVMRRRPDYIKLKEERKWEQNLPVRSFYGARVTFAGTGDIGNEAAVRIKGFKPACMTGVNRRGANPGNVYDRIIPLNEIDKVLPETDVLILSLPSTPETVGLLNEARLRKLPEDACIVNVGRGNVLDERALEKMLREGKLWGAALDVFEKEPLDKDSTLWDCPRLILTTHVAGNWTLPHTVEKIISLFSEDFVNYCEGKPLKQVVDIDSGYNKRQAQP
ncbi:MAG: D-2-hydroxyacid dehydrogenase [Lachnospiraceae bacterium]|nr:D-2-hydroxyacid dehydrogenase [Lachnospiraceae bacterium]